jgi:hypothetical protein
MMLLDCTRRIWWVAVVVSGLLGAVIAWGVVPEVSWAAVAGGWGVAALNSVAARGFNRRAMRGSKGAFVGWGIVGNVFRMLTLMGVFVYTLFSHKEERGSFFISAFVVIFILMLVEVKSLFQSQANSRSRIE